MPSGGHGPDASIFGMTSSYFFAFMLGAEVKRAKMLMSFSPDPEPRAPYPSSKRSSPTRWGHRLPNAGLRPQPPPPSKNGSDAAPVGSPSTVRCLFVIAPDVSTPTAPSHRTSLSLGESLRRSLSALTGRRSVVGHGVERG